MTFPAFRVILCLETISEIFLSFQRRKTMKKTLRIVSLALVVVMLAAVLVACGPSGNYGGDTYTMKFSGSKVTVTWKGALDTYTISGSFKMGKDEEGNKTITFSDMKAAETSSFLGDAAVTVAIAAFEGEHTYNAGKDDDGAFVEIGGARYYKK